MLRRGKIQVVIDSEGNCHHEGRYSNWKGEEVCSLCERVLSVNTRQSVANNMRHGTHKRLTIGMRQIFQR